MTHLSKITRPHWSIKPHPKNWMNKISKQQADTEQQSDNTAESEQDVTSELATVDIFFFFSFRESLFSGGRSLECL